MLVSVGIRQVSFVFHSPSPSKRRPCLSSWLVVGPVSHLETYPPLFSLYPSLVLIFSSVHSLSISITSSVPLSFPFLDDPSQISFSFLSFPSASLCLQTVIRGKKRMRKRWMRLPFNCKERKNKGHQRERRWNSICLLFLSCPQQECLDVQHRVTRSTELHYFQIHFTMTSTCV